MEVEINNLRQRLVKLLEEDTSLSHTGLVRSKTKQGVFILSLVGIAEGAPYK